MKTSEVLVDNIWAEDLFRWFLGHIRDSGGDGSSLITCENYRDVCEWFREWYEKVYNDPFPSYLDRDECGECINYHDGNENFIFSNTSTGLGHHDYNFIVMGDCKFGWTVGFEDRVVKSIDIS